MELDLFGVVVREVAGVLAEEVEVGAEWEAHALGPVLVGVVSALAVEPGYLIRQEHPAIT
jgi:hypothetical protein